VVTVRERTEIIFTSPFRRRARRVEREVQRAVDQRDGVLPATGAGVGVLARYAIPSWAHGARYEKAGPFSHAVVATSTRGH